MAPDVDLVKYVISIYGAVFGVCVVACAASMAIFFRRDPAKAVEALKAFYDHGNGLRILTVLTVLATTGSLAVADKLDAGTLSLLSGVAGFVLGGMRSTTKDAPPAQSI